MAIKTEMVITVIVKHGYCSFDNYVVTDIIIS